MGPRSGRRTGRMRQRANEALVLDEELLRDVALTDFQRAIGGKLLRILETLPAQSVSARAYFAGLGRRPTSTLVVNVVPRRERSAEMTIEIEPSESVHIDVGQGTTYSLPHDVWDSRAEDVASFTGEIVRAVVDGAFRETVWTRGGLPYRWQSQLDVQGIPVPMDRTEVSSLIRGIFGKRTRREIEYLPYG